MNCLKQLMQSRLAMILKLPNVRQKKGYPRCLEELSSVRKVIMERFQEVERVSGEDGAQGHAARCAVCVGDGHG